MEKAHFSATDDRIIVNIPFSKASVDVEKRIVSGFGTIDNPDQGDDVITKEASLKAWAGWRGNVREQHSDLAAGRVVNYRPEAYMADDGKIYNGLYVDVYVSKGAPATWEKVVDGTLTGFSVGGLIQECHTEYLADDDRTVRFITKYKMVELSLVDSPGNELCNVLSIQKAEDGTDKLSGIAAETSLNNVFWCSNDRIAVAAHEEIRKCSACSEEMENIGFYEPEEKLPMGEAIKKVLQASNKLEKVDATKGGSEMSEEVKEEVKTVEEVETPEDHKEVSEEVATAEEPDLASITKALDEIQAALSATQQNREDTVAEINKAVASVKEDVDAKLDSLLQKHSKLEEEVKGFKENLGSVEKSLSTVLGAVETIEKSGAIKKSADVEEITKADNETSFWSNRFLPPTYDPK
jgi:hypothetical protein